MNRLIKRLEGLLQQAGGYILIPKYKRHIYYMTDGIDDEKNACIASIVWVCESINSDGEYIARIKDIDTDGEMWDVEEYMTEPDIKLLIDLI